MDKSISSKIAEKLKLLHLSALVYSFGESLAGGQAIGSSFVSILAIELGATPIQMGLFHSINLSVKSLPQVIWGYLSDRFGKRVPFIVIGGIGFSLLWFPMIFAKNPFNLLILLAIQAAFFSIRMPSWTSLIGDIAPASQRGKITARINWYITLSSLIAILISGYIMLNISGSLRSIYFIPFSLATILGIIGTLIVLLIKEEPKNKMVKENITPSNIGGFLREILNEKDFLKYTVVSLFSNLSMVMLLPIISLITIKVLNVNKLIFALYGVIRCLSLLFSQKWLGKVTDVAGRKQLIFIQRVCYIIIPSLFILVPNPFFLFIPYAILGVLHAITATTCQSYLFDVCPSHRRGSYISIYSLIQGIGFFISSLLGGFLVEVFSNSMSFIGAIRLVCIITTIARIPSALAFLTLREKRTYKSTLQEEFKQLFIKNGE